MDASEWVLSHRAALSVKLAARIEDAVTDFAHAPSMSRSQALAGAGISILERLTGPGRQETPRHEAALDLLAADALVTYALEAAAEECKTFEATADALIARLASLASARKA